MSLVAQTALYLLALMAPFELLQPFFSLGPFQVTNVEIAILLALATGGGLAWTGRGRGMRTPLTWPFLLLFVVLLASTATAIDRGEAVRCTGRFLASFLIFWLVVNVITNRSQARGLSVATTVSGTIVAAIGILEYFDFPGLRPLLAFFQQGPFFVGGLQRASSTLQYPTIASMYLEITFALGMGLFLSETLGKGRRLRVLLWFGCLASMICGIVLTQTRGGLFALGSALVVVSALYLWRNGADRGFVALLALGATLGALVLLPVLMNETYRARISNEDETGWYRAAFEAPATLTMSPQESKVVEVVVTNRGKIPWSSETEFPFLVSYHWLGSDGKTVISFEGRRSRLPHPVAVGESTRVAAQVTAPSWPGTYRIAWDIVLDGRLWFSSREPIEAYTATTVEGGSTPPSQPAFEMEGLPVSESRYQVRRLDLWRAALQILKQHPLLGVGPGNFRLVYGQFLGLQVWNRTLHANNAFLDFLANTGILGGCLFIWLWARLGGRLLQIAGTQGGLHPHGLGVLAAVLVIAAHALVDDFFTFTPTYIVISMSFGLAVVLAESKSSSKMQPAEARSEPLRWICLSCQSPLPSTSSGRKQCPRCATQYECREGIWRFLVGERSSDFEQFVRDYEHIRSAEGRGSDDPEYYKALPFVEQSEHAATWEIRAASYRRLCTQVLPELTNGSALRVLDLGAGNCWFSNRMAEMGFEAVAVDLVVNRRDGLGCHALYDQEMVPVQGDFTALPFEDGQFQLAFFNSSFHYAVDFEATLGETLRVLTTEGLLVITDTPLYRDESSGRTMLQEREASFRKLYGFPSDSLRSEGFLTYRRLEELARNLGLDWQIAYPWYGLSWALRPWKARLLGRREPAQFGLIVGKRRESRL